MASGVATKRPQTSRPRSSGGRATSVVAHHSDSQRRAADVEPHERAAARARPLTVCASAAATPARRPRRAASAAAWLGWRAQRARPARPAVSPASASGVAGSETVGPARPALGPQRRPRAAPGAPARRVRRRGDDDGAGAQEGHAVEARATSPRGPSATSARRSRTAVSSAGAAHRRHGDLERRAGCGVNASTSGPVDVLRELVGGRPRAAAAGPPRRLGAPRAAAWSAMPEDLGRGRREPHAAGRQRDAVALPREQLVAELAAQRRDWRRRPPARSRRAPRAAARHRAQAGRPRRRPGAARASPVTPAAVGLCRDVNRTLIHPCALGTHVERSRSRRRSTPPMPAMREGACHAGTRFVRLPAAPRASTRRWNCWALGEEARVIAGGHSLLPMMKLRLAEPEVLVDINDLRRARPHPRSTATNCASAP